MLHHWKVLMMIWLDQLQRQVDGSLVLTLLSLVSCHHKYQPIHSSVSECVTLFLEVNEDSHVPYL